MGERVGEVPEELTRRGVNFFGHQANIVRERDESLEALAGLSCLSERGEAFNEPEGADVERPLRAFEAVGCEVAADEPAFVRQSVLSLECTKCRGGPRTSQMPWSASGHRVASRTLTLNAGSAPSAPNSATYPHLEPPTPRIRPGHTGHNECQPDSRQTQTFANAGYIGPIRLNRAVSPFSLTFTV